MANIVPNCRSISCRSCIPAKWLGERMGIEQTESVKQAEKISAAVKETPGQKLRRVLEQNQQHQQQRRSRGISI